MCVLDVKICHVKKQDCMNSLCQLLHAIFIELYSVPRVARQYRFFCNEFYLLISLQYNLSVCMAMNQGNIIKCASLMVRKVIIYINDISHVIILEILDGISITILMIKYFIIEQQPINHAYTQHCLMTVFNTPSLSFIGFGRLEN
jgi:hypothetical protein